MGVMYIDNRKVEFGDETNVLAVIRKVGIELPTFCYNSDLSIYGACRMCVVEDERGGIFASCSAPPKDGMRIRTHSEKLNKHRKMILELLLASHCKDCTSCEKNGKCRLQELASKFGIKKIRFDDTRPAAEIDKSAKGIVRNPNKCILCGDCVRMCAEVQGIGAIDFAGRGSKVRVTPAFNLPLATSDCVNCGQCAAVCPTGAIVINNQTEQLWRLLEDPGKRVVAQIAPAVRVAIGEEFGVKSGENALGQTVAALKLLGFDEVYDTSLAADLTVLEEAGEFKNRVENGGILPMFTSCCPGWIQYAEKMHPEILPNISTCRSPMSMFSAVLREYYDNLPDSDGRETYIVAIMPCTAKKYEADRAEFRKDGRALTDLVITTNELERMIKRAGIVFEELEDEAPDMPFGLYSGAGVIFGVTGGVTEAVVRHCSSNKSKEALDEIAFVGVRGRNVIKATSFMMGDRKINAAIVYGLKAAGDLLERIRRGEDHYDFVEVMACPEGCIAGGGQPCNKYKDRQSRARGLYHADRKTQIKFSGQNPIVGEIYRDIIKDKAHELLHVDYTKK